MSETNVNSRRQEDYTVFLNSSLNRNEPEINYPRNLSPQAHNNIDNPHAFLGLTWAWKKMIRNIRLYVKPDN